MSLFSSLSHEAQGPPEDKDHPWPSPMLPALGLAKYQWDTRMRIRDNENAHVSVNHHTPGRFSALLTRLRPYGDVGLKRTRLPSLDGQEQIEGVHIS